MMTSQKLTNILRLISENLGEKDIPYALIEDRETLKEEQRMILEMINASWDLAEQLGKHPVTAGCNCIVCVNGRKRLIDKSADLWEFEL